MSGLPREAPCGAPDQLNFCPVTTSQILQELKSQRLVHPPWTRPSYRLTTVYTDIIADFSFLLKLTAKTSILS